MKSEWQSASPPVTGDASQGADAQWEALGSAQRVLLHPELIQELRQAAIQAFLAIPKRGVEIGGLLLGETRREPPRSSAQGTAVFHIEAFEDVPCDHSFGPSYILGELDRKQLLERLERRPRDGSAPVIGFYRSYTGREAQLDEADQLLLRTFFQHGDFVCLLLQPLSVEKCLACFRFRSGGQLLPKPACEPFPFDAAQMEQAGSEPPEKPRVEPAEPAEAKQPAAFAPAAPVSEIPWHHRYREEEAAAPPGARLLRVLPAALICILFAIAFAAVYQLWTLQREPRWEPLRFDARMYAGGMLLSWDPAAPAVSQARRGVLLANDGHDPRTIPLSPGQLRRGSLSYSPAGGDVRFRLRLYGDGTTVVTDTLRVITTPLPPASAEAPPAVAAPAPMPEPVAATPPVTRHEVQPEIPSGIRRRILSPRTVQVIVDIDESGHVVRASAQGAGRGLDRYLADQAVKAARQWSFTPAQSKSGSPVVAAKTLLFEFTPSAR